MADPQGKPWTAKVLKTHYELDRLHSAALRHTLQTIQDDPEIQAELGARQIKFAVPESTPDVYVRGNRQGIYILLRELIRESAGEAAPQSTVYIETTLQDGNLSVLVSSTGPDPEGKTGSRGRRPSAALMKIVGDMQAGLRRYRDKHHHRRVAEVQLQLG